MTDVSPVPRRFLARVDRLLEAASPRRRVQLVATLALTLAGAIAELVTIGAVLPLLMESSCIFAKTVPPLAKKR